MANRYGTKLKLKKGSEKELINMVNRGFSDEAIMTQVALIRRLHAEIGRMKGGS